MDSELVLAGNSGDIEAIRQLAPEATREELNRALARAACMSHLEAADELLKHGADVNGLYSNEYGPVIFAACEFNNPEGIDYLLKNGAEVADDFAGKTPMEMVTHSYVRSENKYRCINLLIKAGATFDDDPLMAIHKGNLVLLREHLSSDSELLEKRYDELNFGIFPLRGGTLLHLAVETHESELALELMNQGANIDAPSSHFQIPVPVWPTNLELLGGHTPIFHAWQNNYDLLEILLDRGADPQIPAAFLRDGDHVELTPFQFFMAVDDVEGNLERELALLAEYGGATE